MRHITIMRSKKTIFAVTAAIFVLSAASVLFFRSQNDAKQEKKRAAVQEQPFCAAGGCAINNETGASAAQLSQSEFTTITSKELATLLNNKNFFFVNVHIPYEGEIQNTDAFIPYDKISENLDKLPKDKNAKIVLYCRSGRMSEIAAQKLVGLGYTQVSYLAGGMIDWETQGYKIIKK